MFIFHTFNDIFLYYQSSYSFNEGGVLGILGRGANASFVLFETVYLLWLLF